MEEKDNKFSLIDSEQNYNNNITVEDMIRCPECYLIPFISTYQSNDDTIIMLKCLNDHIINKPLKEFYWEIKNNQKNSIKCENCNEREIVKLNYCVKCFKFYCNNEKHSLKENHNILIPFNKIDSFCYEENHNNYKVNKFCFSHKRNICDYCENNNHKGDQIEKYFIGEKQLEILENNIKKAKDNLIKMSNYIDLYISKLLILIDEIKIEFNIFKNNNESEIKLCQDLINIYKLKKEKKELNYQIIQNIKNISLNQQDFSEFNTNILLEIKTQIIKQFKKISINIKENVLKRDKNLTIKNDFKRVKDEKKKWELK